MAKTEKRKRLGQKAKLIISGIVLFSMVFVLVRNYGSRNKLFAYIDSFEPVDYSGVNRTLPEFDASLGHYYFAPNEDLKIMVMTDMHLGGGSSAVERDKKTIYEVITMLQKEKPDLVILDGDNIFAVPGIMYNGGGTFNNKEASKLVLSIFEHEGVYFTTVFGNHDTESFDYYSREQIGQLYQSEEYSYCIFRSEFSDVENNMPSISNQMIGIKNADGDFSKVLMLLDSNDYINDTIQASIDWQYDVIHDAQLDWAASEIKKFGGANTLSFFHIPTGEFQDAYVKLEANGFKDTADIKYLGGVWDEEINDKLGIRIWFGGCYKYFDAPLGADNFFEVLGPKGRNILDAVFCGHDHVNNAVVEYNGVRLSYLMSMDNSAYTDIAQSGLQRGCTIITVHQDGSYDVDYKNAYKDEGVSTDKFIDVYLDHYFYEEERP